MKVRTLWIRALIGILGALPTPLAAADTPSFAWLTEQLNHEPRQSLEDLVAKLPADYRSELTLVYRSRSLQGASLSAPRAILYGKDARMMLAFNGDPAQEGYRDLEVMEFNAPDSRFELHEIHFDTKGAHVSEPNPEKCLRCHGTDPKPIWEPYPFWPGAYLGKDDGRQGEQFPGEKKALAAFVARANELPRYRMLARMNETFSFSPISGLPEQEEVRVAHNHRLSVRLTPLLNQRILRLLQSSPGFTAFLPAIMGALTCAGYQGQGIEVPSYFPESYGPLIGNPYLSFFSSSARSEVPNASSVALRLIAFELGIFDSDTFFTAFRPTAITSLGSPASGGGPELAGSISSRLPELREYFHDKPKIYYEPGEKNPHEFLVTDNLLRAYPVTPYRETCEKLRNRSNRQLADWSSAHARVVPSTRVQHATEPTLLKTCQQCHESGPGPDIPFQSALLLRTALKTKRGSHGKTLMDEIEWRLTTPDSKLRMPPGARPAVSRPLSETERLEQQAQTQDEVDLIAYLRNLM